MKKLARKVTGFDELCAAAAGASEGTQELPGNDASRGSQVQVLEADAFSSVHDMIHAAINSYGAQATLRQVYQACEERGRIAYKRSGGSRLITQNDHWKSQIRHALYTCDRFQRVAEGADLWTISPQFQRVQPQTTKVLIRSDAQGGSMTDDTAQRARGQPPQPPQPSRRLTRGRVPADADPPFLASSQRRKRSGRQPAASRSPSKGPGGSRANSPAVGEEQLDESSHIDHFTPNLRQSRRVQAATPPSSSQMDCNVTPSPFLRLAAGDHRPWQRAARQLNSALQGSDDETGPTSSKRARSAEAESPASTQQLYALRSRSKPPPGFGDNPDPAAERAAREAHAMTTGPLKKRLKAAAKAAEMAVTAASTANEEATSTRTQQATGPDTSCTTAKPPPAWRPPAAAACLPPRGRGRGRGMSLIRQVTALPTHAAHLASLSSQEAEDGGFALRAPSCSLEPYTLQEGKEVLLHGRPAAFAAAGDVQEGADETDEGGSKRLLRSQAAAAAADLERDGDLDRTDWKA